MWLKGRKRSRRLGRLRSKSIVRIDRYRVVQVGLLWVEGMGGRALLLWHIDRHIDRDRCSVMNNKGRA